MEFETKSKLSDEFIFDSYIKSLRFNLTLTLSTIGVITALFNLSESPIEKSIAIFWVGLFLLLAVILSVLGHLIAIRQIIEKAPVEKINKKTILVSFWFCYAIGVMAAIHSLVTVAAQS